MIRPTPMLAEALEVAARGWPLIPMRPSKRPYLADWPTLATTDEATIRKWWRWWPFANPATVVGAGTVGAGLLVLDVDPRHGGQVRAEHVPTTLVAESGSDPPGLHLWFRRPAVELRQHSPEPEWRGCELLGSAGPKAITLPPAQHLSGRRYRWLRVARVVALPSHLVSAFAVPSHWRVGSGRVSGDGRSVLDGHLADLAATVDGQRNWRTRCVAYLAGRLCSAGLLDEAEAEVLVLAHAPVGGSGRQAFTEAEARSVIRRAIRDGAREPLGARR